MGQWCGQSGGSLRINRWRMYKLRNNVQTKVNKTLLSELPYYSCNLVLSYGRVNNILNTALPTKQYLDRLPSYYDLDIFSLNTYVNKKSNFYDHTSNVRCKYYSPHGFSELKKIQYRIIISNMYQHLFQLEVLVCT